MDPSNAQPPPKPGYFDKLCMYITGVDEEVLRLCPQHDRNCVRAIAAIMICSWLYQTALFSVVANRLFAKDGHIRPDLILVAMFLATFILLIDAYMVMRSGWHLSGITELKRGGIDISGGIGARLKAGLFLVVRIFLSICLAQMTAVIFSTVIFQSDIATQIHAAYVHANANLIAAAAQQVDAEIGRATDGLSAEKTRVSALASQVAALRQNKIDPSSNRPGMQQAQQELTQLLAEKMKADEAVRDAEAFSSAELAGIRRSADNSGIPGDGPRRRAAMEAVANAKDSEKQIANDLEAARDRVGSLRKQPFPSDNVGKQPSNDDLPGFESSLAAEDQKLHALQDHIDKLTKNRAEAIRDALEAAPNRLPEDVGLLAQIAALEQIAQADPKVAAVIIILIDVTSFGFELAAVLAKITSFVPTTYAALLARDAYMRTVRMVDEMMVELNRDVSVVEVEPDVEENPPEIPPDETPREMNVGPSTDPFAPIDEPPPSPPPRRRGRPRKSQTGNSGGALVPMIKNWKFGKS